MKIKSIKMPKIKPIKMLDQSNILLSMVGLSTLAGFGYVWYRVATYKPPAKDAPVEETLPTIEIASGLEE
jgi:hypothetical protein